LSKDKETAGITAFFSEAQIALIVSGLPLILVLIAASQFNVFYRKAVFT
jgi:hypothetical protein